MFRARVLIMRIQSGDHRFSTHALQSPDTETPKSLILRCGMCNDSSAAVKRYSRNSHGDIGQHMRYSSRHLMSAGSPTSISFQPYARPRCMNANFGPVPLPSRGYFSLPPGGMRTQYNAGPLDYQRTVRVAPPFALNTFLASERSSTGSAVWKQRPAADILACGRL